MTKMVLLAIALSVDNFAVSIGYGSRNVQISLKKAVLLNGICSLLLLCSMKTGELLFYWVPQRAGNYLGAVCFLGLGIWNLWQSLSRKEKEENGMQKKLGNGEFLVFSLAMSVDGLISGVFASDFAVSAPEILLLSFGTGTAAMYGGWLMGRKIEQKQTGDLSFLGGIIFLALAVAKLTRT